MLATFFNSKKHPVAGNGCETEPNFRGEKEEERERESEMEMKEIEIESDQIFELCFCFESRLMQKII